MKQYEEPDFADAYNVGPNRDGCIITGDLTDLFCKYWGEDLTWEDRSEKNAVHEANFLALDSTKIKMALAYKAKWGINEAVKKTVEWAKTYRDDKDVCKCMEEQIAEFMK